MTKQFIMIIIKSFSMPSVCIIINVLLLLVFIRPLLGQGYSLCCHIQNGNCKEFFDCCYNFDSTFAIPYILFIYIINKILYYKGYMLYY